MRYIKLPLICLALGLTACSSIGHMFHGSSSTDPALQAQAEKAATVGGVGADGDAALKVDANQFLPADPNQGRGIKLGSSSETVERMAKQQGCESKLGAMLITESGPMEKYRVNCVDGSIFMARCELRQCAPMSSSQ
jgi:hypothetical protein